MVVAVIVLDLRVEVVEAQREDVFCSVLAEMIDQVERFNGLESLNRFGLSFSRLRLGLSRLGGLTHLGGLRMFSKLGGRILCLICRPIPHQNIEHVSCPPNFQIIQQQKNSLDFPPRKPIRIPQKPSFPHTLLQPFLSHHPLPLQRLTLRHHPFHPREMSHYIKARPISGAGTFFERFGIFWVDEEVQVSRVGGWVKGDDEDGGLIV